MKKTLVRHLFFYTFVLCVAGFALYTYKSSLQKTETKNRERKVFPHLVPSEVTSVNLYRFSVEKDREEVKKEVIFHLEKENNFWAVDFKGVKDIADTEQVTEWLGGLKEEEVSLIPHPSFEEEEGEKINWREYLGSAYRSLHIQTGGKKTMQVDVSDLSAFDGRFFLRKQDRLFLGNLSWAQLLGKPFSYFRSYKLILNTQRPKALRFFLEGGKTLALSQSRFVWKWDKNHPPLFPLSSDSVEEYWLSLSQLKIHKEAKTFPDTPDFRKKRGLLKPYIRLDIVFPEEEKPQSLYLSSKGKEGFYVLSSDRKYIFSLTENEAQKVLPDLKNFRDHRHPFKIPYQKVHFLHLKTETENLNIKKRENTWELASEEDKTPGGENKKLNQKSVTGLLEQVKNLSAEEYFDKTFEVSSVLTFKDKEEKPLLKLEFSPPFTNKEKIRYFYVKSSLGQEVMSVEASKINLSESFLEPLNPQKKAFDKK